MDGIWGAFRTFRSADELMQQKLEQIHAHVGREHKIHMAQNNEYQTRWYIYYTQHMYNNERQSRIGQRKMLIILSLFMFSFKIEH